MARRPSASKSSSETPMIRHWGMKPAFERWKRPGSSLRRDRSPVAPNSTTTWGKRGPTPGGILAMDTYLDGIPPLYGSRGQSRVSAARICTRAHSAALRQHTAQQTDLRWLAQHMIHMRRDVTFLQQSLSPTREQHDGRVSREFLDGARNAAAIHVRHAQVG